jgi:hypothetical protein
MPERGLWGPVLAVILFSAVAPLGMVAVPLAALLLLSRPASRGEGFALLVAAGFGLWWLASQGTVADQVVRAATLIGAVTFALATRYTRGTVTHRVLLSVLAAACGLAVWFLLAGWSWGAVSWWVERRASFGARLVLGRVWNPEESATMPPPGAPRDLALWLEEGIRVLADNYAAIAALQLMAGLVLALFLYRRISRAPWGLPPGRFRDFRFTEHLGWVGVVSLAVVLVPKLAAAKVAAVNLLIVTGVLYALRGAAVTVFGLGLLGGMGSFAAALLGLAVVFLLPLVAAGAIVLGVIDASFDLRSRLAGRGSQP